MNYVIYNLDGTYHTTFSSIDYSGREEELLNKLKIDFDRVDYIVKVNEDVDKSKLDFCKYMPDGGCVWSREALINDKINRFLEKRKKLLEALDLEFLISLETPDNPKTQLIKKNKNFLRDLSIRDEIDSIHDTSKIFKLNAYHNLIDIEIVDPGCGCANRFPTVFIEPPEETEWSFGLPSLASASIGINGELLSLQINKIGCGYKNIPNIKISDYENGKHPILKPIIVNII